MQDLYHQQVRDSGFLGFLEGLGCLCSGSFEKSVLLIQPIKSSTSSSVYCVKQAMQSFARFPSSP